MFAVTRRAVALTLLLSLLLACLLSSCKTIEQGRVVARVNGRDITAAELLEELRLRRGPSVLVNMIDAELIRQGAEEQGITATPEEMRLRWQRAIAEAGSPADFTAVLERRHVTREEFRQKLRTDLLLDKLATAAMDIDEQEIKDFYREHQDDYELGERVKASMIMVQSENDARELLEVLKVGGDFAGLAKALSMDPATKDSGGDMGWFERDDYAEPIVNAAFGMEPGAISEPIEAPDGWVILRVEGRKPPGHRPLDEVRDEVHARVVRAKLASAREDWIRQARDEATVRIPDRELREETRRLLESAPPPEPVTLLPVPPPR